MYFGIYARMILGLAFLFYLCYQAKSDAKSGTVSVFVNDTVLVASAFLSIFAGADSTLSMAMKIIDSLVLALGLGIVTYPLKNRGPMMQIGDAKAILAEYLCGTIVFGIDFSLYAVSFTIIIANLAFILESTGKRKKGERKPYFPFLTGGYAAVLTTFWIITFVL